MVIRTFTWWKKKHNCKNFDDSFHHFKSSLNQPCVAAWVCFTENAPKLTLNLFGNMNIKVWTREYPIYTLCRPFPDLSKPKILPKKNVRAMAHVEYFVLCSTWYIEEVTTRIVSLWPSYLAHERQVEKSPSTLRPWNDIPSMCRIWPSFHGYLEGSAGFVTIWNSWISRLGLTH